MRCVSRCRQRSLARKGTNVPDGADYFYSASTGAVGLSNGLWGIMRSYNKSWRCRRLRTASQQSQRIPETVAQQPSRFQPKPISFEDEFNKAKRLRRRQGVQSSRDNRGASCNKDAGLQQSRPLASSSQIPTR